MLCLSLMQTALDLDEAQVQDLLYLRRLFCGKIGQLGRARKELMSRVPSETIGLCHASDKLEEVTNVAEQLAANGSEEYRVYMQFASSFYRGVSFLGLEGSIMVLKGSIMVLKGSIMVLKGSFMVRPQLAIQLS